MLNLAFFFLLFTGQGDIALGPFPDEAACMEHMTYMKNNGQDASVCYLGRVAVTGTEEQKTDS